VGLGSWCLCLALSLVFYVETMPELFKPEDQISPDGRLALTVHGVDFRFFSRNPGECAITLCLDRGRLEPPGALGTGVWVWGRSPTADPADKAKGGRLKLQKAQGK
jgi:hypothetical protein